MEARRRDCLSIFLYAKALARIATRGKAVIVTLVACQLLFLLPMVAGYPTGSIAVDREMCRTNAYLAKENLLNNGSDFPEDLLNLVKEEYQHFSDALDADYPSREYFAAFGKAREIEAKEQEAGYLTGGIETQAGATLLKLLSELEDPQVYSSATELPTLNYLSVASSVMPAVTLLLPGILAAHEALKRLHGDGLFSAAPLGAAGRSLGVLLVVLPVSAISPFAVWLPAAVVALARNGLGDPAFPVVLIMENSVTTSTVLGALGKGAVLLAFSAAAVSLFMALINFADFRFSLGLGLLAALLPLVPLYTSETSPWHGIGSLLPTTYLRLDQVVGYPTYANGLDITVFTGATFGRGTLVLTITTSLLAIAVFGTGFLRDRRSSKHMKGGHHD